MTGHGAQALGDLPQQSIAVLEPERIINPLETIEIKTKQRQRLLRAKPAGRANGRIKPALPHL